VGQIPDLTGAGTVWAAYVQELGYAAERNTAIREHRAATARSFSPEKHSNMKNRDEERLWSI